MRYKNPVTILVIIIILLSSAATLTGIITHSGPGPSTFVSVHGQDVTLYGRGIYRNMSADVAIQGIAQDYITLFLAVPLLAAGLIFSRRGSVRGRFLMAGVLNYFLLTYLFYLEMAMYNELFLIYVLLTSLSFFAFGLTLFSFDAGKLPSLFSNKTPVKIAGGFLMFTSSAIALLWLSVVVPPLLDGTIVPDSVQHYTTLTVQGLDLALFLPISFVSGYLLRNNHEFGYLMGTTTLVFLPLLMSALIAKLIAMAWHDVSVFPAVIIIPMIEFAALTCCALMFKNIIKQ